MPVGRPKKVAPEAPESPKVEEAPKPKVIKPQVTEPHVHRRKGE